MFPEETFAVHHCRKIFAFCGKTLSRFYEIRSFCGKKLLQFTKRTIFSGKITFVVYQNEIYFSIFLDTTGAFNGITLFTDGNKLD